MPKARHYISLMFIINFAINLLLVNTMLFAEHAAEELSKSPYALLGWISVFIGSIMNISSSLALLSYMNSKVSPFASVSVFGLLTISIIILSVFYTTALVSSARSIRTGAIFGLLVNVTTLSLYFFSIIYVPEARTHLLGNNTVKIVSSASRQKTTPQQTLDLGFRTRFI